MTDRLLNAIYHLSKHAQTSRDKVQALDFLERMRDGSVEATSSELIILVELIVTDDEVRYSFADVKAIAARLKMSSHELLDMISARDPKYMDPPDMIVG